MHGVFMLFLKHEFRKTVDCRITYILKLEPLKRWNSFKIFFYKLELFWEVKFGYSEKATKFEKIFHLKFEATQYTDASISLPQACFMK